MITVFRKKHLSIVLVLSLIANAAQYLMIHESRPYQQLGRNLVHAELDAAHLKPRLKSSCQTVGILQNSVDGILTCTPDLEWRLATCKQTDLIAKDDQGLILRCNGVLWEKWEKR